MLAATPTENDAEQKSCTVMALLDGGMLRRHKSWLKVRHPLDMIFCRVVGLHEFMQIVILAINQYSLRTENRRMEKYLNCSQHKQL
jgi:hypothetical protein